MDAFGQYEVEDTVEFSPDSGYEHRGEMRDQIMVVVDSRAQNGRAVFVKDYKVVRILDLRDPNTLDLTRELLGQFDAMLINPASVPENALDEAVALS